MFISKTTENTEKNEMEKIRRQFDEKTGQWYFSIVDVIAITGQSSDPRNYWKVLKSRLKKEQNQLVTECNQLKMKAGDGKFYLTDVADRETVLGLVKLVSEEHILPFRQWFDSLETNQKIGYPQVAQILTSPQTRRTEGAGSEEEFILLLDGYREGNIITIQTFVAGADIENLLISVNYNKVEIKGERRKPEILSREGKNNYDAQELYWGKFSRSIDLPAEIEIDRVSVSEDHGLVTIQLPVLNKTRSKLLKIKSI